MPEYPLILGVVPDVDNKTNYHLINILHNIFLLKDLKKLKKLNINNYKILATIFGTPSNWISYLVYKFS